MSTSNNFSRMCRTEREAVIKAWKDAVFATYPLDTSGFSRTQEDRFRNPAGHAAREALERVYDAVGGEDVSEAQLRASLEIFIKLRAVQDFTAIQALGVLYLLKPLLRERILPACRAAGLFEEYLEAESRLDAAVLIACGIYAASREQVLEERIGEIKRQHSQLLRWAQKTDEAKP